MRRGIGGLLLAAACATGSQGVPETFRTGRDPRFASERYIVGVGRSHDLDDARRRAVVSIAGQVQATLRSVERVSAQSGRRSEGEQVQTFDSEQASQDIRQETHFSRPEWVRVVETHREGEEIWVLAVLDRQQAASSLGRELDESTEALRKGLVAAEAEAELTALARVLHGLRNTSSLVRKQRVLLAALRRQPPPPAPELEALDALEGRYLAKKRSVTLWLCLDVSEGGGIGTEALAGRLAALGVRSAPCPEKAPTTGIRIEGRLVAARLRVKQAGAYPWFCTMGAEFRAVDTETGALIHGSSEPGSRAGGMHERQACSESLGHLASALANSLGLD